MINSTIRMLYRDPSNPMQYLSFMRVYVGELTFSHEIITQGVQFDHAKRSGTLDKLREFTMKKLSLNVTAQMHDYFLMKHLEDLGEDL
jgi:hypothetical protein